MRLAENTLVHSYKKNREIWMKSPAHVVFPLLTIVILSCTALSSCSSDDSDPSRPSVAITASVTEGLAPLEVDFGIVENGTNVKSTFWNFGDGKTLSSGDGPVSHIYSAPGEYTVSASFDTTDSATPVVVTALITVLGDVNLIKDVNLIVSSFAIDNELTPGGLETVSAIIQNIGTESFTQEGSQIASGHIEVGYYLSTDETITVDDIYIGDTSIMVGTFFTQSDVPFGFEALAPGENYQYDHQLFVKGNVPAGTYFAGAIVDYIDEYDWYTFPRSTDTYEYAFPTHVVVPESNEDDNVRVIPEYEVTVGAATCEDDAYEGDDINDVGDDSSVTATPILVGESQVHNFCFDNSDWLQFNAAQGGIYKITTFDLGDETDTQLILYDTDAESILLFHDNVGNGATVDLEAGFPLRPASEIVWEAQVAGTYFIKVRTTACDEDLDPHCETINPTLAPETFGSPDGVGLDTEYSITLQ